MSKRVIILIDGGYLRVKSNKAGKVYNPDFIDAFARKCVVPDEEIFRVLYYDCAPYSGTVKLPVSGDQYTFGGSDKWLEELACKDLFAVRRGVLKFRGFKPKRTPVNPIGRWPTQAIFWLEWGYPQVRGFRMGDTPSSIFSAPPQPSTKASIRRKLPTKSRRCTSLRTDCPQCPAPGYSKDLRRRLFP